MQSNQKSLNLWGRFTISLAFALCVFIPLGIVDALTTLIPSRYLFYELGDRLMVLGFTLLIYFTMALIVSIFSSLVQRLMLRKATETPNKCAALNLSMLFGLVLFLLTAWTYNLVLSDRRWTNPVSLAITGALLLVSIVVGILIYRSVRDRGWRRMIALSKPKVLFVIATVIVVLFFFGQINFVRLLGSFNNALVSEQKPNVILISIDTLGAKHLGCYGYHRDTSPELDKIADQGVLFKNAFVQAHWTLPSHMTMLTGLYPSVHGMTDLGTYLDDSFVTLAEALKAKGYRTGAFVDSEHDFIVGADYGYSQGFDFYDHTRENLTLFERLQVGKQFRRFITPVGGLLYKLHSKETTDEILGMALHWMQRYNRKNPFFLFIHLYDVHYTWNIDVPFVSPEPFQSMHCPDYQGSFTGCDPERKWCGAQLLRRISMELRRAHGIECLLSEDDLKYIVAIYDGGISFVDSWIGKFFEGIREMNLDEYTMVVITADHGEEFLEHSQIGHRQHHDEVIHVPLIIWQKRVMPEGKVVDDLAMSVDLVPTILDAAGIEFGDPLQGVSLMPLIRGEQDSLNRSKIFAGDDKKPYAGVVRSMKDKFIINSEERAAWAFNNSIYEYYNLENDSEEKINLCKEEKCPDELKQAVESWRVECDSLNEILTVGISQSKTKMSKAALRKLRALGYID